MRAPRFLEHAADFTPRRSGMLLIIASGANEFLPVGVVGTLGLFYVFYFFAGIGYIVYFGWGDTIIGCFTVGLLTPSILSVVFWDGYCSLF